MKFCTTLLLCAVLLTSACTQTQDRVIEAQKTVQIPDKSNYFERRQIAEAEKLNDRPGKVYWWYLLSDQGQLIHSVTCIGRPVSSTESLEPNDSIPTGSASYGWLVPLEGSQRGYTTEMMGLDGTYGDPVPFRYCITPEGHYFDASQSMRTIVSSIPLTFEAPKVRFDEALEAKKLQAEAILRQGGCIDSGLNKIDCKEIERNKE